MAQEVYIGDEGTTFVLDCGQDISDATVRKIKVRKPDGTEVDWTATASGSNAIQYSTGSTDLNLAGKWKLQAYIEMPGWKGLGNTCVIDVKPRFN